MRWLKPFMFTLLSLLLLLQAGGLIQIYKTERTFWHYRMLAATNKPPTVSFTLSVTEYERLTREDASEIAIGGKMHDIVNTLELGDSVAVIAVPDAEEDIIVERISQAVHNTGKELPTHLWKLFDMCYLPADIIEVTIGRFCLKRHHTGYNSYILARTLPEIAYPPEYC